MSDRLLRKSDIAAMLGTSPGVAASILSQRGCQPVNLGYGRGKGVRWLESAVVAVLRSLHMEAQAPPQASQVRKPKNPGSPKINFANISVSALYEVLTPGQKMQ